MKPSKEHTKKKIGEILLEAEYISQKQLDVALLSQYSRKNVKLGQILLDLGFVTQRQLQEALKIQSRF